MAVVLGGAMTPARAATTDATLAGRVVADGTNKALSRICVTAYEEGNGRGGALYSTTTGLDGRYSMTVGGGYDVRLQFEDCDNHVYAPEYFSNTPYLSQATLFQVAPGAVRTINVGLAVGSVLTGRLTDARSGAVVRGVTVWAQLPDTLMATASATSGPAGMYKITGLAAGSYHVWTEAFPTDPSLLADSYDVAAAEGVKVYPQQSHFHRFAVPFTYPGPYDAVVVGRSATFTLNEPLVQGGIITGRVTRASDGLALPGVCVEAYVPGWMRSPSPYDVDLHALVTTDQNGRYSIRGLRPGNDYVVLFSGANLNSTTTPAVSCPGSWQPQWWSNSTTVDGATRIHLSPYGTIANVNATLEMRSL